MAREPLEKELEHLFREDLLAACKLWGIDVTGKDTGASLIEMLATKMKTPEERERIYETFTHLLSEIF